MKKILTIVMILLIVLSMFVILASQQVAVSSSWTIKQLTKNNVSDTLSSAARHVLSWDGSKVVFTTYHAAYDFSVYVMNTTDDPGQEKRMTVAPGRNHGAAISGDGEKIVFNSNRKNPSDPWYSYEIFVMNTTDNPGDEIRITDDNLLDHDPDISGNGEIIAWHSAPTSWTGFDIKVANISDMTNIAFTTIDVSSIDEYPSIRYDGKSLSFWSHTGPGGHDGDVYIVNSDGTGLKKLIDNSDTFTALSGDGSRVAFQRIVGGDYEIFVYDITRDTFNQLTDNNSDDILGGIDGDGNIVTYSRDGDIFIHDMTTETQLTDGNYDDNAPRICGDGSTIVFRSNRDGPDYDIFMIRLREEISASVDIDPDTLNLKSNGQWITAYITLPEGYSVGDIDVASVELIHNDVVVEAAEWGEVQDGVLMVKFDRAALRDYLGEVDVDDGDKFYDVTLTVKGNVAGAPFEGNDIITVKRK